MRLLHLLLVLPLAGCVTSADIRAISDDVADFERVLYDETATREEVADASEQLQEELEQTARDIEARTAAVLQGMQDGSLNMTDLLIAAAGAAGTAFVGVNASRNAKRRQRQEPV